MSDHRIPPDNGGACPNCTDNRDGSHTCLGEEHPDCRINARQIANDVEVEVSIEILRRDGEPNR